MIFYWVLYSVAQEKTLSVSSQWMAQFLCLNRSHSPSAVFCPEPFCLVRLVMWRKLTALWLLHQADKSTASSELMLACCLDTSLLSRPNKVGSTSNVRPSVRLSVRPQKVFSISMKLAHCYVDVDEWCTTVCSMMVWPNPRSRSQALENCLRHLQWEQQLTTHFKTRAQYLNLIGLDLSSVFVMWLWTWQKHQLQRVNSQSCTGPIYYFVDNMWF